MRASTSEAVFLRAEIAEPYFTGTSRRMRKVVAGVTTTLKLTQKVRVEGDSPEFIKITILYLTPGEFEMLPRLPAKAWRGGRPGKA